MRKVIQIINAYIDRHYIEIMLLLLLGFDITKMIPFIVFPWYIEILPIALFLFLWLVRYGPKDLGFTVNKRDLIFGSVIIFQLFLFFVQKVAFSTSPFFAPGVRMRELLGEFGGWYLVQMVLVGPILEELVYRSVYFALLKKLTNAKIAIVMSALIWASMHSGIYVMIGIFVIGILYALLRNSGASIYVLIAGHIANNLLEFVYAPHNSSVDTSAQFLFVFLLVSMMLLLVISKKNIVNWGT